MFNLEFLQGKGDSTQTGGDWIITEQPFTSTKGRAVSSDNNNNVSRYHCGNKNMEQGVNIKLKKKKKVKQEHYQEMGDRKRKRMWKRGKIK